MEIKHKWMLQLVLLTTTFLNLTLSDLDHKGKRWGNLGKWLKKEELFRAKVTRLVATQDKFSCFLQPHGLQHASPHCPSATPTACSNSCHWVSDAIQPFPPLSSLLLLSSVFPSIRVFSNESVLGIGWPKYGSFSFSISPSNEYSGLTSFRIFRLMTYFLLILHKV